MVKWSRNLQGPSGGRYGPKTESLAKKNFDNFVGDTCGCASGRHGCSTPERSDMDLAPGRRRAGAAVRHHGVGIPRLAISLLISDYRSSTGARRREWLAKYSKAE